jgi:hypothetical protein
VRILPATTAWQVVVHSRGWRIATDFVAGRPESTELVAVAAGYATLAAHDYWLSHPSEELALLNAQFLELLLPS